MNWFTKLIKGSGDKGHWKQPNNSVVDSSDFNKEEIDRAIALSLSEKDQKGKKAIEEDEASHDLDVDEKFLQAHLEEEAKKRVQAQLEEDKKRAPAQLEEDEQLATALQESIYVDDEMVMLTVDSPPRYDSRNIFPITDHEHPPRCDVCGTFIPPNIEYMIQPFWLQKYCSTHEHDGTPRCCSCERMEPRDMKYLSLDDGRRLCLECLDSAITDTDECRPLYFEIKGFYEGLNMKVEQDFPMLLVERQALNEAMEGEKNVSYHLPKTRGLCVSEEQIVATVLKRPGTEAGCRSIDIRTISRKLVRKCEVTAILILYGLPRLLTGSILAHEMMHAWLRLKGYSNLNPQVEEGICQVLAHMWLDSEIYSISGTDNASSSISSSPSTSSKKGKRSDFEKKLGECFRHQIQSDQSPAYGEGFKLGNQAVQKYGLRSTIDHIRKTGSFPL